MSLARAIETGDVSELPSRRDEDWRWTDLRALIRQMPPPPPESTRPWPWDSPFEGITQMTVGSINGLGANDLVLEADEERFVAWRFMAGGETAHASEFWVTLGSGARLTLIEAYDAANGGYVRDLAVRVEMAEGSRLERIVVMDDDADGVTVSHADVVMAAGAVFAQTVLTTGAKRQRIETRVEHPGQGASVRMDGAYLLSGKAHADITTSVRHNGVDGTTVQLTKGVVRDQARGVFQGRITVAEGADRTDARMGHHALILSERAEVDAKPELLIFADDVQCAHGNTIGALDEDAIFYARQRGMSDAQARSMLTEAFIGEVIDRIEHEGARDVARAWAAERLGGA